MRRSKRKASALAARNIKEASTPTAADASATKSTTVDEDQQKPDTCEVDDCSDDEGALHGPCNVKPCDADENPRFVYKCLLRDVIYLPMMDPHVILHAQGMHHW